MTLTNTTQTFTCYSRHTGLNYLRKLIWKTFFEVFFLYVFVRYCISTVFVLFFLHALYYIFFILSAAILKKWTWVEINLRSVSMYSKRSCCISQASTFVQWITGWTVQLLNMLSNPSWKAVTCYAWHPINYCTINITTIINLLLRCYCWRSSTQAIVKQIIVLVACAT